MGGICGSSNANKKPSTNTAGRQIRQAVIAPTDDNHLSIEEKYAPYQSLDHEFNINKRLYWSLYTPLKDVYVGKGIKKTNGYQAHEPLEEIKKKRKIFWDTRIENSQQTWAALKMACESEDEVSDDTIAVMKSAGIKLIRQSLSMCYDENGFRYELPIFIINDPSEYKIHNDADNQYQVKSLTLKIRVNSETHSISCSTETLVEKLISDYKETAGKQDHNVKLIFGGKPMQAENHVGNYITNDCVIQAFVTKMN